MDAETEERIGALPQKARVNFEAAFVKYCGGLPLEDISLMMDIPLTKLESRARHQQWPMLKNRVEQQSLQLVPTHPAEMEKRAELIQQNREKNYAAWEKLRDDAVELIGVMQSTKGKGMFKRYWQFKGSVVEHETDMSMSERVQLATYLQTIAQGTYAALGDRVCSTGAKDDSTSSPSGTPGITTIILPAVVSRPRQERQVAGTDKASQDQVIDLR